MFEFIKKIFHIGTHTDTAELSLADTAELSLADLTKEDLLYTVCYFNQP